MSSGARIMRPAVFILIAAVIAGTAGYFLGHCQAEREGEALALAHALEKTSLCANALNTLDNVSGTTTARLLDHQLRSALAEVERYSASAPRIHTMIPNLLDALRRAAKYAERIGDRQLVQRISQIEKTLAASLRHQRQ